ncbi:MAG TPA: sulfurtransferase [Candidatus Dormibacteraeota bacterium]|nr:sulfurtransferase [Candidatus Dormibacteraeota bacterium]
MSFRPVVSAGWLAEHLEDHDLRIVDFRWTLQGGSGHDKYLAGHIPGAVFVALEDVTGKGPGRHPLPAREQFQEAMRQAGVDDGTRVVVYDDVGASVSARLWFLLRWFGHHDQAVLDGGFKAWTGPVQTDVVAPARGTFTAREPDRSRVVDREVVRGLSGVPVLDSRLGERYRGETEPVDPKAGHIPGALNAPYPGNLDESGRFLPAEKLRERFDELGVRKGQGAVVYCGSGVNATHNLLAMELAGIDDVRLYEGSWSDWSSTDEPIATGPNPDGG